MKRWREWAAVCLLALGSASLAQTVPAVVVAPPPVQADHNVPVEYGDVPTARAKANEILSRKEFGRAQAPSWWDSKLAKFGLFVSTILAGMGAMIPNVPWFGTALVYAVLAAAAVGLLIWVLRANRQQRVAIATGRGEVQQWQKESDNWAERAREEAGRGDWREAVHCLYWSAIVLLEGQKMWRQNRARTPREYVVLLEDGSAKRQALGGLTRVFERIWYGLRPADESDYTQAAAMLEQLRAR